MIDIENEAEVEAGRRNHEVTTSLLRRLDSIDASRLVCHKSGEEEVCHFRAVQAKITKLKKTIKKMSGDFPGGKPPEYEVMMVNDEGEFIRGRGVSDFWKDKFQQLLDMTSELASLEALDYLYPCGDCRACVITEIRSANKSIVEETSDEDDASIDNIVKVFREIGHSDKFLQQRRRLRRKLLDPI